MKTMFVTIHDIMPCFEREIGVILDRVQPYIGMKAILAVVPGVFGKKTSSFFRTIFDEKAFSFALHGFDHRGGRRLDLLSYLTGGANEMSGRAVDNAVSRLSRGKDILEEITQRSIRTFIPPCWQMGPLQSSHLSSIGIDVVLGLTRLIHTRSNTTERINTWFWDCGRFAGLGYLAGWYGNVHRFLCPGIPCLAFHPQDVNRGFLNYGIRRLTDFLNQGFSPVFLDELEQFSRDGMNHDTSMDG